MKAVNFPAFCALLLQCGLLCQGSKFNPKVKVRTRELGPSESSKYSSNPSSGERTGSRSKSLNPTCAGVNCMPQPIPAQGSPQCKPRYDGDSCCPTWICASDEILAKGLFDENNNWNVKNEYQHDMFEDIHHHDEDEDHEEDDEDLHHPHPTHPDVIDKPYGPHLEPFKSKDKKKQFQKYAAKGKLDNKHNKNFIARMEHENVETPVSSSAPVEKQSSENVNPKEDVDNNNIRTEGHLKGKEQSISDNYAAFKRNLQNRAQLKGNDKIMRESAQAQANDYPGVNDYKLE